MAKGNAEIRYEESEDILSFWRGKPSQASIEIGDFIIDVDSRGYISGLEILNASVNLRIESKMLEKVEKASLSVLYKPNYVYILLNIKFAGSERDISIPLTIDLGHKTVEKEEIVLERWKYSFYFTSASWSLGSLNKEGFLSFSHFSQ